MRNDGTSQKRTLQLAARKLTNRLIGMRFKSDAADGLVVQPPALNFVHIQSQESGADDLVHTYGKM